MKTENLDFDNALKMCMKMINDDVKKIKLKKEKTDYLERVVKFSSIKIQELSLYNYEIAHLLLFVLSATKILSDLVNKNKK